MVTSITAPSVLTITPPISRPRSPIWLPCWRSWSRGSTSVIRSPSIRVSIWANSPKASASAMPAAVPTMAHTVFFRTPPRMVRLTTVI